MFALAGIFFLLAVHPFVTYPLSLYLARPWLSRRWRPAGGQVAEESYAICLCAYNEEAIIAQKIENLLALRKVFPGIDILVYVDAAEDRTAEILSAYTDRIQLFVSPHRYGKTHGMNFLVSKTRASIVLFTDANVMLDIDSMRNLPSYFVDPKVGCVCGHLKYMDENETVTAKTGSLYWRLEETIKSLESDTGSVMGADGSLFAIRRELHKPPPDDIIDDMHVSLSILCNGYQVVRASDVIVYEKSVSASQDEYVRKIRIACQAFNVHRLLWPKLRNLGAINLYKYLSHKFVRWFTIYWIALAAICFQAGMILSGAGMAGLVILMLGAVLLYLGLSRRLALLTQAADIMRSFAATGIGVWRSLLGDRFQTWSPPSSARTA